MRTRFYQNYFLGEGFGKTETNVFEIRRGFGFGFRPQKGVWGMNAGGILFGFSAGLFLLLDSKIFDNIQSYDFPTQTTEKSPSEISRFERQYLK